MPCEQNNSQVFKCPCALRAYLGTPCWAVGRRRTQVSALTFTSVAGLALLVSRGAFALVRTHRVDAVATLAEAGNGLTFIHIYRKKNKDVRKCDKTIKCRLQQRAREFSSSPFPVLSYRHWPMWDLGCNFGFLLWHLKAEIRLRKEFKQLYMETPETRQWGEATATPERLWTGSADGTQWTILPFVLGCPRHSSKHVTDAHFNCLCDIKGATTSVLN